MSRCACGQQGARRWWPACSAAILSAAVAAWRLATALLLRLLRAHICCWRPHPKRRRGRGRGRGRGGGSTTAPGSGSDPYYQKRKSSGGPKYREDSDEEFLTDEEDLLPGAARCGGSGASAVLYCCCCSWVAAEQGCSCMVRLHGKCAPPAVPCSFFRLSMPTRSPLLPCPAAAGAGRGARQAPASAYARHFARLLENQGSWEAARGHTAAPFMPPPREAWEGLGQHAPELAEVAAGAADVASSLQYFEVRLHSAASFV